MKKNIGFVSLSAPTLEWLVEKLKSSPLEVPEIRELQEALLALGTGESQTLMVELGEMPPLKPVADIVAGDLCIRPGARKAMRGQQELALTPKEFDILLFLARNRGEVFTKEQIYRAVWEEEYLMDDSNIMAFIRKLRKKIEPNPDAPEYILTIWGIGYTFTDKL